MSGAKLLLLGAVQQAVASDPYFENTTLLLPGNGTNGAQNNTFLDSSTNAFSITRNGNTTQGTFSPFSQTGWGAYFDGTGDYLTVTATSPLQFGTGDFAIEMWVNFTKTNSAGGSARRIFGFDTGSPFEIYIFSTGTIVVWDRTTTYITSTVAANTASWVHVAVTRSGTDLKLFLNGVQSGSTATVSTNFAPTTIFVGANPGGPTTGNYEGYISNLRMVKGAAVYTGNFTPPTVPLTDISGTGLLTCQSNRFIDNSSNAFAITVNGNTSIQAFSPFNPTAAWSAATNGGSGYFDGSGDFLTVAATSSLAFGSGDYTIEGWFYVTGTSDYFVFDMRTASGIYAYVEGSTGSNFVVATSGIAQSNAGTYRVNAWNHFAFVRSGSGTNNTSIYLNGIRTLQGTDTTNYSSNTGVYVGARYTATVPFVGYISDFRCVKGTAVYSGATYAVPTAPLTAITNTQLLTNFTNAGIYDATAKNDLETVGNAQISTTQSKFDGSSMYFDGTGDYLVTQSSALNALGSGDFTIEMWLYPSNTSSAYRAIIASDAYTATTNGWTVYQNGTSIEMYYASGGSTPNIFTATSALTSSVWQHFALVRSSGTLKAYVNGTQVASVSNSINFVGDKIFIGDNNAGNYFFNGYIDDLRITKGIARYTASFTPPTTASPVL